MAIVKSLNNQWETCKNAAKTTIVTPSLPSIDERTVENSWCHIQHNTIGGIPKCFKAKCKDYEEKKQK